MCMNIHPLLPVCFVTIIEILFYSLDLCRIIKQHTIECYIQNCIQSCKTILVVFV